MLPRAVVFEPGEVHDAVDDLVREGREARVVGREMQRFGMRGERVGSLDDDEIVDVRTERVQTDFQPVELAAQEEEVVDLRGEDRGKYVGKLCAEHRRAASSRGRNSRSACASGSGGGRWS